MVRPSGQGRWDCLGALCSELLTCYLLAKGFFNVYGNAARKDNHDYVVHLGDYIYEDASSGPRAHKPANKLFTLYDYRTRHGQYRTDNDLQLLAQNHAWIPTWDDHGKSRCMPCSVQPLITLTV